jgi:hypothetical protein
MAVDMFLNLTGLTSDEIEGLLAIGFHPEVCCPSLPPDRGQPSALDQNTEFVASAPCTAERIRHLVSDPGYPSYEILLDTAAKLLDVFEKK